jgi:hypothetical protein
MYNERIDIDMTNDSKFRRARSEGARLAWSRVRLGHNTVGDITVPSQL